MGSVRIYFAIVLLFLGPPLVYGRNGLDCEPLDAPQEGPIPSVSYGRGLLFKVYKGGGAPSHVFGTIHVGDERVTQLPAAVSAALKQSRQFVMEVALDGNGMLGFLDRMFYQDGKRLVDQIGPEMFSKTALLLSRHGLPEEFANQMKPWAAYMMLTLPPGDNSAPLDLVLMQQAAEQNIPVNGLETMEEQAEVFDALKPADQVALLKDTVCHYETVQRELSELVAHYLDRDLAWVMAQARRYQKRGEGAYTRFMDELLWMRNQRMVDRMLPKLKEGQAFIAIGALHLPGSRGVLALLEQKGYRVSVVY